MTATYIINLLRILIIVGMIAPLGTDWVFIAHAVVGRVFFFVGIVIDLLVPRDACLPCVRCRAKLGGEPMNSVLVFMMLWGVWLITPVLVDGLDTLVAADRRRSVVAPAEDDRLADDRAAHASRSSFRRTTRPP